jgi:mevalonate kinase
VKTTAVAEAPSKAIITGEHFVVHGSHALAASLGRKVRVEVTPASVLSLSSDRVRPENQRALAPVRSVIAALASEYGFRPEFRVKISSTIPRQSGMGSSASTMVAVVAAVARYKGIRLALPELVRFAMEGEKEIHGNPSGVDVNACAYGGVILFRMGATPQKVRLSSPRRLIVAYSGRQRSTKTMIDRVFSMKSTHPRLFQGLADSVDELSLTASDLLSRGELAGLGRLLTLNHAVLSCVGVSNNDLDAMVEILLSLGCYGAKLTGAGGGGSVIGVAPESKGKSIISQLAERGFEAFEEQIPVEGVKSWLE